MSASPGRAAPSLDPPPPDPDVRFDELYRSAGTAVLGYSLRRCASRDDALDVTAETFLVAWRRRAEMPTEPDEARAWLFGVARWCLANLARRDRRSHRLGRRLAETMEVDTLPDPARIHEGRTGQPPGPAGARRAIRRRPGAGHPHRLGGAQPGAGRCGPRPDPGRRPHPPAPRPPALAGQPHPGPQRSAGAPP